MTGLPPRYWRLAVVALAATVATGTGPVPAHAHAATQAIPDAAFYRTELSAVTPAPPGVSARVDPGGDWVEVSNAGTDPVIVLGYRGEPYLRVTAQGTAENALSESTYLNRSLFADSVPTAAPPSTVAPEWRQTGLTGTARWHDHRIHWMGQARPPAVAADPRHAHLVGDWVVHATAGTTPFEVRGVLRWIGKPDSAEGRRVVPEWLLTVLELGALGVVLAVGLGLARRRRPVPPGR